MVSNGNGKWKMAFWIMAVVCVGGLGTLTTGVVANDRIRAREDQILDDKIHTETDKLRLEVKTDLKEIKTEQSTQGKMLERILAKLE